MTVGLNAKGAQHLWILPLVAGFAPLAFLLTQESGEGSRTQNIGFLPDWLFVHSQNFMGLAVVAILLCAGIAAFSRVSANRFDNDRRPEGLLLILAGQLVVALNALVNDPIIVVGLLAIGVGLSTLGILRTVAYRMGSTPVMSERELGIAACGMGVLYYVLVTNRGQREIEIEGGMVEFTEQVLGVVNTSLGVVALFAALLTAWLMSTDRQSIAVPLAVMAVGFAATTLFGWMASVDILLEGPQANTRESAVAVIGLGAITAAYIHPQAAHALAPSVIVDSEVNVRRSIISFSVVLIGPLLVGINLVLKATASEPGTDPLSGQETDPLSPVATTIGASALSLLVAMHLLGLVRRWVKVEHQGQHDPLTSLPNRPLFFSRLELTIESARLRDSRFATMFLDLDRFKAVNDTLGHDAGDELLRQVANRLQDAAQRVSSEVTVARLGGDEFAIIVPETKDARHAHAIGRLFLDQFLEPFDVGLRDIYVTPSIGMAEYPKDGTGVDELIENADTAMFEAKERGRNTVVAYSPEQRIPGAHRLEIEAALHRAVERNELELYFQPQIDLQTGKIFAVESLIRWVHPTLGRISPEKFVPVAEESSLIDSIGQWIIDEACRAAARWEQIGLPPINVAVNLSPRQFQKSVHLVDNVSRALRESGLSPHRLELELTESLALEKPEEVNETLIRFKDMGIRTAIDDFGVGHTGLDYLDRIEVDTLKIDRSFINRIGESGAPLVTAVISLAKGLELDVIAEGVETRAQVNFLAAHGCRYMQGYLFSKPLTGAQLEQVLRNQMRRDTQGTNSLANTASELPSEPDLFDSSAA